MYLATSSTVIPPCYKKVAGVNQPRVQKSNNGGCFIFLLQWFKHLLRGPKTVLMYFLNIVTLHDVIYVQTKGF